MPEVPSCLGTWCWHCVLVVGPVCARGAFVPGCLVAGNVFGLPGQFCARGAFLPGCLVLVMWCPGQFVPEVPTCLGTWGWHCDLLIWPVCARGASVPGCLVLAMCFGYLAVCARGAFVPGCLVLVMCFGYLASSCPRCLRAWVLGAGYVLLLS